MSKKAAVRASLAGLSALTLTALFIATNVSDRPRHAVEVRVANDYGDVPLSFEANEGQADPSAKFISRGAGYELLLEPGEVVLKLFNSGRAPARATLRMKLVGGSERTEVSGVEPRPARVSYFVGKDPRRWRAGVPTYGRVEYREVYSGIDLVYYGRRRQLEYDFVLKPGADPSRIRLRFEGAGEARVEESGDLVIHTGAGEVRHRRPFVYQESAGVREEIAGGYVLDENGEVGFRVAAYDRGRPLVIDPAVIYATYFDAFLGTADGSGNVYTTRFSGGLNCVDKLNAAGSAVLFSTCFGGGGVDSLNAIAVDGAGNVYVTGQTTSNDFPTVNPYQAVHGGGPNHHDIFVTKIDAAGGSLVYSTFLGANGDEGATAIAVDGAGSAYVAGGTGNAPFGNNFPTVNAIRSSLPPGEGSSYVVAVKFNPAGSGLVYSTYVGAGGAASIAVDPLGSAYLTGTAYAFDFPVVNAVQATSLGGTSDAFATKINPAGSAYVYSTLLGGSGEEAGRGVATDASGNTYVAGETNSTDFYTADALQPAPAGGIRDAFVAKLGPAGAAVYSTYLGGSGDEQGFGVAADSAGNAYVTGVTASADFPVVSPTQPGLGGAAGEKDAFLTRVKPLGDALDFSTYLGGSHFEHGRNVSLDSNGNAYVVGATASNDFPTKNAFQPTYTGGPFVTTGFIAKFDFLNDAPNAAANGPFLGVVGMALTLDASASSDPEGTPLTFEWDFGDATTLVTTQPVVTHTYESAGTYNVSLVVSDGEVGSAPYQTQALVGFGGGGQRQDVNAFLSYLSPTSRSTTLAAGTASFNVTIIYGEIIPGTFRATLNGTSFGGFNPAPHTYETVTIPLSAGSNKLLLAVDGVRADGRTAAERDTLTFNVP